MRQPALLLAASRTLPTAQLIHGDCLEVMPALQERSVQCVFADLPYGATSQNAWDVKICLDALWLNIKRLAASFASPVVFTANFRLACALFASNPTLFRYDLVWDKRSPVGFLNAKRQPLRRHEHVMIFAEKAAAYVPQMTAGKPYSKPGRSTGTNYGKTIKQDPTVYHDGMRYPTSILPIPSTQRLHPTGKPEALLEWIIKTYTNLGDTILDPTAGSMTTAVAALRTGRNSICIEKDAEYFRIGRERVAAERARLEAMP